MDPDSLYALGLDRSQAERLHPLLERYLQLLEDGADRYGLVSTGDAADRSRLVTRHILDSIAPWRAVASALTELGARRVFDLGSGAGLPGVPLALLLDDAIDEMVLVERSGKRVRFLEQVAAEMAEARLRIVADDADRLDTLEAGRGGVQLALFRAYQQTTTKFLKQLARGCGDGARVIAWKGRYETAEAEAALIGASDWARDPSWQTVEVPGLDAQRCILTWTTVLP